MVSQHDYRSTEMNETTHQLAGVCREASARLTGFGRKTQAVAESAWNKARTTARATDEYVHDSPWTLIGAAALVAAAVGYVLGRR
jgi:ElaB/YqjD/DUF883 family membrane-anchored ribosome-binding protein